MQMTLCVWKTFQKEDLLIKISNYQLPVQRNSNQQLPFWAYMALILNIIDIYFKNRSIDSIYNTITHAGLWCN